jgi:hypothetical protein
MTEQESMTPTPGTTTGLPGVDQVIADLDGLDELPVDEHLAAFERAHSSLRGALDAEPDNPA